MNTIVPQNKANKREEKARLEKIKLESELRKELSEKKEVQIMLAEAEFKIEAAEMEAKLRADEVVKVKRDYEFKFKLDAENLKEERSRFEAEREKIAAEIERQKKDLETKLQLERESFKQERVERKRIMTEVAEKLKNQRLEKKEAQRKSANAKSRIKMEAVAKAAKKEYKIFVTSVEEEIKAFLTDVEIETKHLDAQKKALDYFEKHKIGSSILNSEIMDELNQVSNWLFIKKYNLYTSILNILYKGF